MANPQIDRLEDRWSGGDLLLQICADDPLTVAHAARVLASGVRGVATQRWVQRGFRRAVGTDPSGRTQRNLFGQLDGTVNPAPAESDFEALLFSDGAEQQWMRGGDVAGAAPHPDDDELVGGDRPKQPRAFGVKGQ